MKAVKLPFEILEIKRVIYCMNLLKTIESTDLVINIDEWTINRNTHPIYSWSQKNKKVEFKSIIFDKSISIISGVSSDGWSFSHLLKTTINSSKFIEYLIDFDKFIHLKWKCKNRRIIIILDNASIHSAKNLIEAMQKKFAAIFFLPQYSPQYAPVENFFSVMKSNLCSKFK